MSEARTVVVLAAGEGKRMRSSLPKVLHPLLGRTLLGHVLHAAEPLGASRSVVVVGVGAEQVIAYLTQVAPQAEAVLQAEQREQEHSHGRRWCRHLLKRVNLQFRVIWRNRPHFVREQLHLCEVLHRLDQRVFLS